MRSFFSCLILIAFLLSGEIRSEENRLAYNVPASSLFGTEGFEPEKPTTGWTGTLQGGMKYFENQDWFQRYFRQGRQSRMLRSINLGLSWIPDLGSDSLGLTELRTGLTVGLPAPKCKALEKSFFAISPSFTYTSVQWDDSGGFPDSLYRAGLSVAWMKSINERWNIMLNASPSYAADGKATSDTVRCPVFFAATWTPNPRWKVMLGFAYLDRSDLSFLPVAGFTYQPNEDWKFELMAPRPRIVRRMTAWSDTTVQRWAYLGFGFDGGSWAVESASGRDDLAMYREYSLTLGIESIRKAFSDQAASMNWNLEIAYLFGREIKFDHHTRPKAKFDDSLALRLKYSF